MKQKGQHQYWTQLLTLVDKHFLKDHKLRKILNRKTIKISYSCMNNTNSRRWRQHKSPYNSASKSCNLCRPELSSLNKRNEFVSSGHHRNKPLLCNKWTKHLNLPSLLLCKFLKYIHNGYEYSWRWVSNRETVLQGWKYSLSIYSYVAAKIEQ